MTIWWQIDQVVHCHSTYATLSEGKRQADKDRQQSGGMQVSLPPVRSRTQFKEKPCRKGTTRRRMSSGSSLSSNDKISEPEYRAEKWINNIASFCKQTQRGTTCNCNREDTLHLPHRTQRITNLRTSAIVMLQCTASEALCNAARFSACFWELLTLK
jgi:hypothetical protein